METYQTQPLTVQRANGECRGLSVGGIPASFAAAIFPQSYTVHFELPAIPATTPKDEAMSRLTERQRVIAQLVVDGHSNKAIAADLGISEGTVKAHSRALMGRLGISRRGQLPKALSIGSAPASGLLPKLTRTHGKVIALIADGKTNKEIARALGICEATVKIHTTKIYRTLGVRNRAGAAARYLALRPVEG